MELLGRANYIHSLASASATFSMYLWAGGNLILEYTYSIQDTAFTPYFAPIPLKFEPSREAKQHAGAAAKL